MRFLNDIDIKKTTDLISNLCHKFIFFHEHPHETSKFCHHKWKLQHQLTSLDYTSMTTVAILLLWTLDSEAALSQLTYTVHTRRSPSRIL